ncbi:MAG: GNAT family N-acetyltransferase [Parvibaculum sp.]|nr:GNAT family N-acetyltransferase [Parvibaculum sp.]
MSTAAIGPLAAERLAEAAALHALCFDTPWDEPALARLLAMPGTFALAVADAGEGAPLSGFVLVRIAGGEAEILTVAVVPPRRGQGLGRRLVEAAAATALAGGAAALFLEVAEDNEPALALYRRLGFREVGARPGYYARGQTRIAARVLKLDFGATSLS